MEKATCCLEITIISAEGLRLNGRSVKKNAFVIVRTDPSCNHQMRCTSMDKEGGSYPSWNQKLEPLSLPNPVQLITVEVQCKTSSGVIRSVGTSRIPVSDFMGDYTPPNYLHFLSYRLRDRDGQRNGVINFSIRTVTSQCFGRSVPPPPLLPPLGIPAAAAKQKNGGGSGTPKPAAAARQKNGGGSGTALGVPVPVPYRYGHGY